MSFSKLNLAMAKFEDKFELEKLNMPQEPWQGVDATPEARVKRLVESNESYWAFDSLYFPKEMYSGGFSAPAPFHKFLISKWNDPGISFFAAARKHAKTSFEKKSHAWQLLTSRVQFAATLSSTMTVSVNILNDIAEIIKSERIRNDFAPEILEDNEEQFSFRLAGKKGIHRLIALSEGRSARGATLGFMRLQRILVDDLETRQSPFTREAAEKRIKVLNEAYQSMDDKGVMHVLCNNFHENCAINILKVEKEQGVLPAHIKLYFFPAWNEKAKKLREKPLWFERFHAKSEAELRSMLNVADESEWQGDFQQKPIPPDGIIFKRRSNLTYNSKDLPRDARGVLYCDPNLSEKSKGDTTCIIQILYSPTEDRYFIPKIICRSFSGSNDLLSNLLNMKDERIRCIGMDGNVSQQSTWTNNVRNYSRIYGIPYPPIQYCRYNVDELTKNASLLWEDEKILFSNEALASKDGQTALTQIYSFAGKKARKTDDAPDALICGLELLFERHLVRRKSASRPISIIKESFF